MINLTDVVPQETEPEPQNWFYEPFETTPHVCPLKPYEKKLTHPEQGKDICLLSGKRDFEKVKIFTKDF